MKFTPLKQGNMKMKHITVSEMSLDMSRLPCDVKDNCLTAVKNMINENGRLVTRQGLYTTADGLLDTSMCDGAESYEYSLTDTEVNIDGVPRQLVTAKIRYDDRNYFILVFGIGENQDVRFLGYMIFGRVDDTTFFCPENIVFYTGKAQSGGGIFALVTLRNQFDDSQTEYGIYEINSDYAYWERCVGEYIPTVYINGTGNAYEEVDWKFSSSPKMPERRNLLSGGFYAYYSSDGVSSSFRLPFTNIDNSSVICRIYTNIGVYSEWVIYSDSSSAKQNFYGAEITANVDRNTGMVYFTTASNSTYSIPIMSAYRENNIRILAQKEVENGLSNIVSSKYSALYKNKWLFSGGDGKNKIYYADYETPLYFPEVSSNEIGANDEAVSGLKVIADRIIAFKSHSMYEISVKNGGDFNTTSLLADNGAIFKKNDTFSVKQLSNICSSKRNTVAVCGEKLVWLGCDNAIYSLAKNSSSIEKISHNIDPLLREIGSDIDCYAAGNAENYILSYGRNAIIINLENNKCFYWEFPEGLEFSGIVPYGRSFSFLYRYNGSTDCYVAGLLGESDILFKGKGYKLTTADLPILCDFALKCFDFDAVAEKKSVKKVDLRLCAKGKSEITVGDRDIFAKFDLEQSAGTDILNDTVTLITDLAGARYIEIAIKSNKGISFGGADIYFC